MMKNTVEANVYKAMVKAQEQFDVPGKGDEWTELELIIADYAYHNGCKIWDDCDTCYTCMNSTRH